ncbi:glycosyltransferase family 2 protein [Enterobacter sichuanensis]|mgnify:FL=1|jgi:glycosyltransferase involved in cell wall biosynthesis|uniref:Family 2 glycosyl transferase n=3 Tax=Gammaproteobacteria TaxID=1236 RepID=A0A0F1ARG0_9ENTR|nr:MULTISPECIES: glycosyltransferase family 2 protein [Enterobacter]KJN23644.1 family 2 glycosyl transferase [Enterobacter sichuanensis]MBY6353006.1 glycosyltransferase family 2 protein [Enterobacter sichuanensis]MCU6427715.1 glycosyltransferase family 2 protein [Enterobacter sichuanensis]MCX4180222.1 glycosyltransferase [Enterobacter sp. HSTU-ASh6]MDR0174852.1 glycosyltransferase family 2 protein [Enterobacter sichuanensis]
MFKLTVCLLTCNSARLLREVIPPLLTVADEIVVVDSGSTDTTLDICREYGLSIHHHPYAMHGAQMNYAVDLASNDWVLCMDSDEILDAETVDFILALKAGDEPSADRAWRIARYWHVLGEEVRTIYPVSSPDFPVRLFNRTQARFNHRPVDDKVEGKIIAVKMPGRVRHDTFYNLHEVFNKLNSYTTRLVKYQPVRPSIGRGIISAIGAFFKWYLFSGAWRQGKVGVVTGLYATAYSFLKYFKSWYQHQEKKEPVAKEHTDSQTAK